MTTSASTTPTSAPASAATSTKPKLVPCLWFNMNAEEAVQFYAGIIPDTKVIATSYYTDNMPLPDGTVLTVEFELAGQRYTALNGGDQFPFTEAISLQLYVDDQAELDRYWAALTADGGSEGPCGWLKDKYGLSWQIVPTAIEQWINDPDRERAAAVAGALMKMHKIDIAALQAAADNASAASAPVSSA
ncbi:VOC family protein [Nakamurella aerolata]|uniref:VOC family protein n=1 Tax=Nakamurella aerolata TaxID=1656892 RepID=A0A849ACS7_9ACTN|nr:VOC family protein [Nakamurella aerolata]NNG34662.1 VOC family protein [Nakamurella aerolata]